MLGPSRVPASLHAPRFLEIQRRAGIPILPRGHDPIPILIDGELVENTAVQLDDETPLTDTEWRVLLTMLQQSRGVQRRALATDGIAYL